MPAISFHLAVAPSYLFIYHRSHIMSVMQTVTGNVCVNSNKSAVTVHAYVSSNGISYGTFGSKSAYPCTVTIRNQNFTFPLLFFLPIFPFSSIIMISVHLAPASLYAGNFFTSYWFLRFSCSVFSMISMTIFILTHSKGKR